MPQSAHGVQYRARDRELTCHCLPRCQLPAAMCHVTCQAARGRALACWSRSGSSQTVADGRRCPRGRLASIRLASGSAREVSSGRAAAAPLWGLRKRSTKVRQRLRLAARPGRWVHRATARGVGSCGFSIVSRALAPSCGFSGVAVAAIPARGTEEAGSVGERAEGELQPEITPEHAPSTGEAGDTNMPASHHCPCSGWAATVGSRRGRGRCAVPRASRPLGGRTGVRGAHGV